MGQLIGWVVMIAFVAWLLVWIFTKIKKTLRNGK